MSKVILDAATRAKLHGLTKALELYDEDGNLLGYITPANPGLDSLPRIEGNPFTEEEMTSAFEPDDPGRPLADILKDLRKL